MNGKEKFGWGKILFFSLIFLTVLLLAGCTSSDTKEVKNNDEGTENQNIGNSDNGDDSGQYASNLDPRFIENWTWVSAVSGGEPVTEISYGWLNFEADGTWNFYYDYGYTERIQNGTWQAKDGELYWGTEGSEISDWYAYDNYEFDDGDLIIIQSGGESRYRKQ
ncbi:MAG TPA: hypothetical protein VKP59_04220 [Candidatus Thermoplasmatota archaeon]|nr:hypothetical protein [Candidatus Thermoplasmatota archaeon]